jgi:glutathione S-transferase
MAVKFHRCSNTWVKIGAHPCWKVQKALDEAGIEYEMVKHPARRSKREDYIQLTGQNKLPAIEFEDGRVLREESKDMAARIKEGRLRA